MPKKIIFSLLIPIFCLGLSYAADENITITTYYPSPYGSYRDLRITNNLTLQAEPINNDGPQIQWRTAATGRHWNIDQVGDRLRFFTENGSNSSLEEKVTILENGNMGIGTITPGVKLTVMGQTYTGGGFTDQYPVGLKITETGHTTSHRSALDLGMWQIGQDTTGNGTRDLYIYDSVAGQSRININTIGYVGIGVAAPMDKLHVAGMTRTQGIEIDSRVTTGWAEQLRWRRGDGQETHLFYQDRSDTNSLGLYLGWGGFAKNVLKIGSPNNSTLTVGIGVTTPDQRYSLHTLNNILVRGVNIDSDARYKKNVKTIQNALDKINRMRGVEYEWKTNEFPEMNFSKEKQIGLIAQEVENVIPEIVSTNSNGYKSLDYSRTVAILIEAIKEQQKEISELKTKVAELGKLKK